MVHLDGRPWGSVSLAAAGRFRVGDRMEDAAAEELQIGQQRHEAYRRALRYLGVRDRSVFETRQKLKREGFDPATIDQVLAKLVAHKYIDDQTFALNWVNYRQRNSPRSARLLARELKQKGISPAHIQPALALLDDHTLALACIHRKRRRWRRYEGRERRLKMLAHLGQKGFSYEISIAAVEAYRDQTD